jgi:hypothetical protein
MRQPEPAGRSSGPFSHPVQGRAGLAGGVDRICDSLGCRLDGLCGRLDGLFGLIEVAWTIEVLKWFAFTDHLDISFAIRRTRASATVRSTVIDR